MGLGDERSNALQPTTSTVHKCSLEFIGASVLRSANGCPKLVGGRRIPRRNAPARRVGMESVEYYVLLSRLPMMLSSRGVDFLGQTLGWH